MHINSGLMLPGLNAIMGPTGSGKTTYVHNCEDFYVYYYILLLCLFHTRLLDVLADRKASSHISGSIFIDGVERRKDFRFLSGYVVQVRIVRLVQCWKARMGLGMRLY